MRACFCSGPRPGHMLCPCREREDTRDRLDRSAPFMNRIIAQQDEIDRLKRKLGRIDRITAPGVKQLSDPT